MTKKKSLLTTVTEGLTVLEAEIMAILGLDDAGKLHKFFKNEIKNLNSQIAAIENNKLTAELELKLNLNKIDDKIEDAEEALEDSYREVRMEEISSNEAMSNFSKKYWDNIEAKTQSLKSLESKREAIQKEYDEVLKTRNEKIEKLKLRISKIS